MCGICGVINIKKDAKKISLKNIKIIEKNIASRGPDARGSWLEKNKNIAIAVHRLSTQDDSPAANQPSLSSDKDIIAIMNGEIYNHLYLKNILKKKGYKFTTNNDTEVVANSFHYWGDNFLKKLEGQFAIFVYNLKKNKGLLARDEHGISPLYYSFKKKRLYFSSSEDSLNFQINTNIKLNKKTITDFIVSGSSTKNFTIFENIKKLEPGHYLKFETKKNISKCKKFKSFDPNTKYNRFNNKKLKREIFKNLHSKVIERSSGSKKVGIFLSGGIDSAIILGLFKKIYPKKQIITLTASFEDIKSKKLIGEHKTVKKICKYFNVKNILVRIKSKDIIKNLGTYSSPDTGILEYCNRALAKKAKNNGIDIILSGEGSDEMFLGYDHNLAIISILKKEFSFLKKKYELRSNTKKIINKNNKIEDYFLIGGADIDLEKNRNKIFKYNTNKEESLKGTISKYIKKYKLKNPKDFHKISFLLDYEIKIPNIQLRRSEGPTMSEGVEMRFPFLNYELKKLVYDSPLKFRINRSFKDKILLRQTFQKLIPKFLNTEKMPFGVPAVRKQYFSNSKTKFKDAAWNTILNNNLNKIKKDFEKPSFIKLNIFNQKYLNTLIKNQESKNTCFFDPILWRIWALSKWNENQIRIMSKIKK